MPRIPRSIVDEMVAHSREDLPNEACGMVHARDGVPTQVHRVKNDAASPYRYEMNPLQMMRLERGREDDGESLFAIYHSHVGSKAYPSPTDVRMAFFPPGEMDQDPMFPGTFYILVSLEHEEADVRAYYISRGGEVNEEAIELG
jgi:[CysO sulfur-carrier protein]-S-L-cysteine hydrolase